MKILLIETQVTGHHGTYLQGLLSALDEYDEYQIILPERISLDNIEEGRIWTIPFEVKGRRRYFQWIRQVKRAAKEIKPDLIHFTYADDLYRYFGVGLRSVSKIAPLVATYHQIRRSKLRDYSLKRISGMSEKVVVHTKQLYDDFEKMGITNVKHIEYPQFTESKRMAKEEALERLRIEKAEGKILLALGGTREDKGLDILLEALKQVKQPFHLIVAGKEEYFKKEDIESRITEYGNKVSMILEFLSDEKMRWCLNASDIIVLPYRKSFDGASGPLGEGVWLRKEIVGPAHGSLKKLIEENHLGRTFISECADDLGKVICLAIEEKWECDEQYESYRETLDPLRFAEKYRILYQGEIR